MLVVVAIIAILGGIALTYAGEQHANLRGFAEQVTGECDAARLRAISSRKWNRLSFDADTHKVVIEQATVAGMATPAADEWTPVQYLDLPRAVTIYAITETADVAAGNSPDQGSNVDDYLMFAPDGSSVARTVYLQSMDLKSTYRLVVYRATGTVYVKEGW